MTDFQINRRELSRQISAVENGTGSHRELLRRAYGNPVWPEVIGVTGPPGAGKSTLVDAICADMAQCGQAIAVLAVDPSSPYSGGALLGDRIRMKRSSEMANVLFRSLSSRNEVGGLSAACLDVIAMLGLAGFKRVLVETVGAGQSDIDVMSIADAIVVVSVPGLGDQVQALKSGIMEIGDIYIVNKFDREGASETHGQIERNLATAYMGEHGVNNWQIQTDPKEAEYLSPGQKAINVRHGDPQCEPETWRPPVIDTVAQENRGISEVVKAINGFLSWQLETKRSEGKYLERIRLRILRLLSSKITASLSRSGNNQTSLADAMNKVESGAASPQDVVEELIQKLER